MPRVAAFTRTTVGKKVLMAITGFILLVFVIVHMIGNSSGCCPGRPDRWSITTRHISS